jgi:hypothetical protein
LKILNLHVFYKDHYDEVTLNQKQKDYLKRLDKNKMSLKEDCAIKEELIASNLSKGKTNFLELFDSKIKNNFNSERWLHTHSSSPSSALRLTRRPLSPPLTIPDHCSQQCQSLA